MEQLSLFKEKQFVDKLQSIKKMLKTIVNGYENENSWLYCDSETAIELIKIVIFFIDNE